MSDSGAQVWLGEDRILRVRYPKNCHLTLELMEEVHRRHVELIREPCPLLVYAESVAAAEYEAQQFASSESVVALVSAMAIIVKSAFTRAMGDLFMRFHKPPYPTKIFRDEASALQWLSQFNDPGSLVSGAEDGPL